MIENLVILQNDHRRLARIAALLETRAALTAPPDTAGLALLVDTVYYLTHFPDMHHHPCEDALASWLHDRGTLATGVVALLTSQHADLATSGTALLRDLESLMRAETESWAGIAPRLRGYAGALRSNMATEEKELLPAAFAVASVDSAGSADDDMARMPAEARMPAVDDPLERRTAEDRFRQLRTVIVSEANCDCDDIPDVVPLTPESGDRKK